MFSGEPFLTIRIVCYFGTKNKSYGFIVWKDTAKSRLCPLNIHESLINVKDNMCNNNCTLMEIYRQDTISMLGWKLADKP
jgi:hypothetical protein